MIYDTIENARLYKGMNPHLDRAIEFMLTQDLNALPMGRTEIDGSNVFCNKMEAETMPVPDGAGNLGDDVRVLVETIRVMFDQPEVRMALPGLIADTVADPELHDQMIARLAGNLPAFERRFGRARSGDQLPLLVEVVAGAAIFRILVRRDAALDDDWVDQMVELIVGRRGFDADVAEGS